MRDDLFITFAQRAAPSLRDTAERLSLELDCPIIERNDLGFSKLFVAIPEAQRAIVVQSERLLLLSRDGWEFFFHPNLGYLRATNYLRGTADYLVEAAELGPGRSILDCTLGLAGEATLASLVVGPSGEVHGVEAMPEMGVIVREGLQTRVTKNTAINDAMRRIQVVHLGHHLEYLRACPDKRYDVVYFDPFFDTPLDHQETLGTLRAFGDHGPLLPEAFTEAKRVARDRVVVKTARYSPLLDQLKIDERLGGRGAKVIYGIHRVS